VLNPSISYVAAEQGFKILRELRNYIQAVQFTAISARPGWAYQNPKLIQDYLLALLRGNRYVYETAPEMIRDFLKLRPITRKRVYDHWVRDKVIPSTMQ
jgi:hypothetical protein